MKKCPKCNSTRIVKTKDGMYCKKCGFKNSQKEKAKIIEYSFDKKD